MDRCLACATLDGGVVVPGGVVWEDSHWAADHCLGPFPPGSLVLKTKRHCESLPELSDDEAAALGLAARIRSSLTSARAARTGAGPPTRLRR